VDGPSRFCPTHRLELIERDDGRRLQCPRGHVVTAWVALLDGEVVGVRRGLSVQRSEHALFTSDALALRASFRGFSGPLWDKARTPVEGTDTVSPYVVLEDR
jgi:hypothetical protein